MLSPVAAYSLDGLRVEFLKLLVHVELGSRSYLESLLDLDSFQFSEGNHSIRPDASCKWFEIAFIIHVAHVNTVPWRADIEQDSPEVVLVSLTDGVHLLVNREQINYFEVVRLLNYHA